MGKTWPCVVAATVGCVFSLGCGNGVSDPSVLFEVKEGADLSLVAYGDTFARTGRPFTLAKVLPSADMISIREEEDGTTSFLIDTNEPILFLQNGQQVDVSLVDWVSESKTRLTTFTIAVRGPSRN